MELKTLKSFVAVATLKSFSAAFTQIVIDAIPSIQEAMLD